MNWPLYETRHEADEQIEAEARAIVEKTFRLIARKIDRNMLYTGEQLYEAFTNLADQAKNKRRN